MEDKIKFELSVAEADVLLKLINDPNFGSTKSVLGEYLENITNTFKENKIKCEKINRLKKLIFYQVSSYSYEVHIDDIIDNIICNIEKNYKEVQELLDYLYGDKK